MQQNVNQHISSLIGKVLLWQRKKSAEVNSVFSDIIVNYVKTNALNLRLFSLLSDNLEADHKLSIACWGTMEKNIYLWFTEQTQCFWKIRNQFGPNFLKMKIGHPFWIKVKNEFAEVALKISSVPVNIPLQV